MGTSKSKQRTDLLIEALSFQDLIEDFERSLTRACTNHFANSLILSTLIHCDVSDRAVLESKLLKYDREFKAFCHTYLKFKRLIKIYVKPREKQQELEESYEVNYNYKGKEKTFVNIQNLYEVVDKLSKLEKKVSFHRVIKFGMKIEFSKLKSDVSELVHVINGDKFKLSDLKLKTKEMREKLEDRKIKLYNNLLISYNLRLLHKQEKYKRKYYKEYVMKLQETFNFDDKVHENSECPICLEEFLDGFSVTKLKCGHLFCTACIEKWFKDKTKCPCCRQKPLFTSMSKKKSYF